MAWLIGSWLQFVLAYVTAWLSQHIWLANHWLVLAPPGGKIGLSCHELEMAWSQPKSALSQSTWCYVPLGPWASLLLISLFFKGQFLLDNFTQHHSSHSYHLMTIHQVSRLQSLDLLQLMPLPVGCRNPVTNVDSGAHQPSSCLCCRWACAMAHHKSMLLAVHIMLY